MLQHRKYYREKKLSYFNMQDIEDSNKNGKIDTNEPDPNDADSDDDGVLDGHAKEGVADSDSDGIKNCLDYDSDDDGVYDGTELGVTTPIPERDEIGGTDINSPHFVIDSDPATTTDPTEEDDDGDHLLDGLEDKNHNGAFDDGETDPLEVDTDGDGLYDGSEANQDGIAGEDSNDDGIVDDDESDPCKKDTDGDNLWDGDEVAPEYIDYDKYDNRYKSGSWYSSDPFDVDSDGDGLNDDQEIIGWPVRIFWEATLETVKGPYDVYSNPMVKDTDGEGLEDDQEFAYGADPDEDDTDDDNVDDDVEVERGDNPCGIEGRPPEITDLSVSAVPVVDDYQGTPYLKGWDVTVTISAEDSSGPYKFALKVLGGTLVEVELQEEDEDGYYKTEIDGSATVYIKNDGTWDYFSAFITSTEDSVGNVLGTYIIGDGLPQYSNNILTLINDGEDAVNHKRDVSGVEYESVPDNLMEIEDIGTWLFDKIKERLVASIEQLKGPDNLDNSWKLISFYNELSNIATDNDPDKTFGYIITADLSPIKNSQGTRGDSGTMNSDNEYYGALAKQLGISSDFIDDLILDDLLEGYEKDSDSDGLSNLEEDALGTNPYKADTDNDGLLDGEEVEISVIFRTNAENGDYSISLTWVALLNYNKYFSSYNKYFKQGFYYKSMPFYNCIYSEHQKSGSKEKIGTTPEGHDIWLWVHYGYEGTDWEPFGAIFIDQNHDGRSYSNGIFDPFLLRYTVPFSAEFLDDVALYPKPLASYFNKEVHLISIGTSPTNPDTDGDGLTDGTEIKTLWCVNVKRKEHEQLINHEFEYYHYEIDYSKVDCFYFTIDLGSIDIQSIDLYMDGKKIKSISHSKPTKIGKGVQKETISLLDLVDFETIKQKHIWKIKIRPWAYPYDPSLEVHIHGYSNPNEDDTDNDGLNDKWEYDHSDSYGLYLVSGANVCYPDIFVEVDYMENHKMTQNAINIVESKFKKGVAIHIDDGSMNGGEKITPYIKYLNEDEIIDLRTNFESSIRGNKFYYCVFAHKLDEDHEQEGLSGFPFLVLDENLDSGLDWHFNYVSHEEKQASVFMHELGHNLELGESGNANSIMWSPDEDPTGIRREFWPLDFTSGEWINLDLPSIESH